ncbi:hypothetical protein [Chryseobacterium jejuense]|uniref:Uncharacterized protein n=1 Tax=Chryseobacterium jejuense TaxID=445960 RepID=A0A2X2VD86_CHRJE|nr:hypothetical protein [Chryseobacterium jejuense]SDI40344.1 hypothetical protein SAMN05421542_1108 [Chryseobacterium jejuense]SQB26966.1 Uncharacterised protein [Chryseobacterium jejuense]
MENDNEDIRYIYEGNIITIPEENIFTDFADLTINLGLRLKNVKLGEEWCREYEYDSESEPILIRKMYNADNTDEVYYCVTYR